VTTKRQRNTVDKRNYTQNPNNTKGTKVQEEYAYSSLVKLGSERFTDLGELNLAMVDWF